MDHSITISNLHHTDQCNDLVSVGLPFPEGVLPSGKHLEIVKDGQPVTSQMRVLGKWPDGSVRWGLARLAANLPAQSNAVMLVRQRGPAQDQSPILATPHSDGRVSIDTGRLRLTLGTTPAAWIETIEIPKQDQWSSLGPSVHDGQLYVELEDTRLAGRFDGPVEMLDNGPVACELLYRGSFVDQSETDRLRFVLRLLASAGSDFVSVSLTLHNPRAQTREPPRNGHWRLGLPNAVMIKDAGLRLRLPPDGYPQAYLAGESGEADWNGQLASSAILYQDSSGGENWHHKNHVNRDWQISTKFRGYRMLIDGIEAYTGNRSSGWGALGNQRIGMAVGVEKFWQNFPNAIRVEKIEAGSTLTCALFPHESRFAHELQGGEQKTHHLQLCFFRTDKEFCGNQNMTTPGIAYHGLKQAMERHLQAALALPSAEQVIDAKVIEPTIPYCPSRFPGYEMAVAGALEANLNLYSLREKWDEYGWRNFGDVIADCEGNGEILSHYNLEYDLSRGMLVQALRRSGIHEDGARQWADLGIDAARHQADIDIYHTAEDPASGGVYNGGKFTHTAHAIEAGRATHRQSDSVEIWGDLDWPWGRGGAPESGHFDNVGMMLGHYLTGDPILRDASIEIADLVVMKVSENRFPQHGYDRTAGNNIMCCLQAWLLTWDDRYRQTIETILQECQLSRIAPDLQLDDQGLAPIGDWCAAVWLKHAIHYITEYERISQTRHESGRAIVLRYADCYHKYGWHAEAGVFAYSISEDPNKTVYSTSAAGWFILTALAWAARLRDDEALRERDLLRCQRMMQAFCSAQNPGGQATYFSTKTITYTTNGGHNLLASLSKR